ncbi:LytTR family DNA-binding domain-containing protein [Sphingomonas sp. DT-207]|uniref:LytTR family DNA-binding domain-containing protein n=1 Tax=Sphingomonas sp. DT-207 TaxID=3396167 RepID=UPI003F19483F
MFARYTSAMAMGARESIWNRQIPLGAGVLLALLGFLLGYAVGGVPIQPDPFATEHPAQPGYAKMLVWGAAFAIALGCREPLRDLLSGPRQSPALLLALAFVPPALTDMLAAQFAMAISFYPTCAPGAVPLPPFFSFLPRSAVLGTPLLLLLLAWGRHLANRDPAEAPQSEPLPLPASPTASSEWLDLPEAPLLRIRPGDVQLIRSAGNYSEIVANERVHLVRVTLTELAHRFAPIGFVRVHRQIVVNARKVREVHRDASGRPVIHLACGTPVPLGRRYLTALNALG